MPPRQRRTPQEILAEIRTDGDGISVYRPAPLWSKDKLGILWSYLTQYALACKSAGDFYFVDGLSGPGLYFFRESKEWFWGSTPMALRVPSGFRATLSMDLNSAYVDALRKRTSAFGERAIVERGNVNQDLLPRMVEHIPRRAPCFVLLDPEGTELQFQTVAAVSGHRQGRLKAEQLILLATSFLERLLPGDGDIEPHNLAAINRVLPFSSWQELWQQKREGAIPAERERQEYARRYCSWLRESLGYKYAEARPITRPGSNAAVYHLIFASDHPGGERIMRYVFGTMYPNEPMQRLPGFQ